MFFSTSPRRKNLSWSFVWLAALLVPFVTATDSPARILVEKSVEKSADFGIIKGVVRDEAGSPIADAAIAIFRGGTSKLLKEVRSASDGSFLTKVLPGTYTILAVAQGFNSTTVTEVQVNRAAELNYGFKLEKAGSGNTLPEKRADRYNPKWITRAAQSARSIYQHGEGASPIDENKTVAENGIEKGNVEESVGVAADEENSKRRAQSVVETYFADSIEGNYEGLNFATLQPLGEKTEIVFIGQTGTKSFAPNRIETIVKTRPNENHQFRLATSVVKLGKLQNTDKELGQISFQAADEWKIKNGVILVLGFDYSRFVGAGSDSAINPRLGLQFDVNSKTRFRTAYTGATEERSWERVVDLEDTSINFHESSAPQITAIEDAKPLMNKSRRFEFGIERVLDNKSSVEATAFFDAVVGRGISLTSVPVNVLNAEDFAPFTISQQGTAQGVRVVYSRRLGKTFSASAGYAFGRGQKLSPQMISSPVALFDDSFFQSFVGQINADLKTGTQIKTVFRLSPEATIFAIDPFAGRLAIYDPGLSVSVTQPLPTLGLPIHAEAMIDARNIFDFQNGVKSEQGSLLLNLQRRSLRGGISVRF